MMFATTDVTAQRIQTVAVSGTSDMDKIGLTAVATFIVFVIGQIIQRIVIEPIQEQRKVKGRIIHTLSYHRWSAKSLNAFGKSSQSPEWKEANGLVRNLAAELRQSVSVIPCYGFLAMIGLVLKRDTVRRLVHALFQWSKLEPSTTYPAMDVIGALLKVNFDAPQSGKEIDQLEVENKEIVKKHREKLEARRKKQLEPAKRKEKLEKERTDATASANADIPAPNATPRNESCINDENHVE